MDNSIQKIQAQHDLFNKVLDFYNQSRIKQDLAVIDALTFRKDIMDTLDKVEDDECLLKSMEALIDYIASANKISEEVDDLAVALFSALNMKDIPRTYDYLNNVLITKLSIFCKSKAIFHVAFYHITGMSNTNKSVAENFSFIEHVNFLDKTVELCLGDDGFYLQSDIFLSQLDFSFFRDPYIFTIFQDEQYQSLFSSYLKCYSFLKKADSLSEKNKDIYQEFVKNFIEYYIYYGMKSFLYTRQGYIVSDIPVEQAADILNNIDLLRYLNLDEKEVVEASNDISSLTGIEKYLDSKTFKAISERASRFSEILYFLRHKPETIQDIISNKLKNDYVFLTLIILSKWKNAFWFSSSFLYESPIFLIKDAFHNHKKIKNHQLKKFAFKILDFINNEDWNNRLYYLTHNYYDLQEDFDIDELIADYCLAPDDFFIDRSLSSDFIKTYRPTFSRSASDKIRIDEKNGTNDSNEIYHVYKNAPPINICFFTNEKRNEQALKNNEREAYPDMAIEKEEYNEDKNDALLNAIEVMLDDLEKVQSYPSESKSDDDFGELESNFMEEESEDDEDTHLPFLPKNQIVFSREEGSDNFEAMTFGDFLLKKQEQKKNIEMKISPDTEEKTLNHTDDFGEALQALLDDSDAPSVKTDDSCGTFNIYDASAEAELNQHVEDLGDESKGVVALYKKIKRLGNSRNLYNNDLLFKNIDNLKEAFPNFSSFIDHIEGHAILNKRGDNHFYIPPSLLVGDPGIGKTFFLSEMAELFGIKREVIHMETISASWLLTGASAQWKDAKTGLIFNKTINSTHANNMIILDELDKALNTSNYPPANSLLQLFEQHTAKQFKDEYFPLKIDVSKMVWLATANDLSTISEPLLSRLDTFRIINPNFEERKQLANRIYSSILNSNTWGASFDSNLADTVLDKLCEPSDSIREMKKTLMNAIKNCAKRDDSAIILEDVSFDTNQSKSTIGFR